MHTKKDSRTQNVLPPGFSYRESRMTRMGACNKRLARIEQIKASRHAALPILIYFFKMS